MATTKTNTFLKKYLTSNEIGYVVSEMLKYDDAVIREIVKVGMVAQIVVKDLGKFDDCDGIYDYVVANGIDLEKNIVNYSTIDKLVDKELSVDKFMKDFLTEFEKTFSETLNGLNLENAVKELKLVAENHEDVVNK